jgi:uncharacterized protein YceH (UPF0502 family)
MFRFEELSDVQATLQRLMERENPVVKALPRQAGTKEIRYMHLLAGDVAGWEPETISARSGADSADGDRISRLEEDIAGLKNELAELKRQVADFRKQFE